MQLAAYRRYAHYDYSRGAALFITLATEPRRCLFGDVVAGEMRLSPFGRAVAAELAATIAASPDVRLYGWAVLPDHLHFRLYLMPGLSNDEACRRLNRLVGRFKSRTTHVF